MENTCGGCKPQCHGMKMLVMGIVVLVTAVKWPMYIWHVVGGLLALKGLICMVMPTCPCQKPMDVKKGKK